MSIPTTIALKEAVRNGDITTCQSLLINQPNININSLFKDDTGIQALLQMALHKRSYMNQKSHLDIIKLLINHGADLNAIYETGEWNGKEIMSSFNMIMHLLMKDWSQDTWDLFHLAVEKGGDVNVSFLTMQVSLFEMRRISLCLLAQCFGYPDIMRVIIRNGGITETRSVIQDSSLDGKMTVIWFTPIHSFSLKEFSDVCAYDKIEESLLLLLNHGADVNAMRRYSKRHGEGELVFHSEASPISLAVFDGNIRIAILFMMYGADTQILFRKGKETQTIHEMIKMYDDDELKRLMYLVVYQRWDPDIHKYFPQIFKDQVKTLILCLNRYQHRLFPKEIVCDILKHAAKNPCFSKRRL